MVQGPDGKYAVGGGQCEYQTQDLPNRGRRLSSQI